MFSAVSRLGGQRELELHFSVSNDRDITVRSCVIHADGYCNRTTFDQVHRRGAALSPPLHGTIKYFVSRMPDADGAVHEPDFFLQQTNLILSGAHVRSKCDTSGSSEFTLKFGNFIGDVSALFSTAVRFDHGALHYAERISVEAFSDIVLPLLDSARFISENCLHHTIARARSFERKISELELQSELLKRFVQQRGLDSQTSLQPDHHDVDYSKVVNF